MNGLYQTPYCIAKGHETWLLPRVVGPSVSVLSIYFDCVKYVSATASVFKYKNVVSPRWQITPLSCHKQPPQYNGHFSLTPSGRGWEVRLYDISQVRNTSQLWTWLENVFIPVVYAGKRYNGQRETRTEYTGNMRSILVGMPRLRQLRVMKGTEGNIVWHCFALLT